jgi:hypothetical protein
MVNRQPCLVDADRKEGQRRDDVVSCSMASLRRYSSGVSPVAFSMGVATLTSPPASVDMLLNLPLRCVFRFTPGTPAGVCFLKRVPYWRTRRSSVVWAAHRSFWHRGTEVQQLPKPLAWAGMALMLLIGLIHLAKRSFRHASGAGTMLYDKQPVIPQGGGHGTAMVTLL